MAHQEGSQSRGSQTQPDLGEMAYKGRIPRRIRQLRLGLEDWLRPAAECERTPLYKAIIEQRSDWDGHRSEIVIGNKNFQECAIWDSEMCQPQKGWTCRDEMRARVSMLKCNSLAKTNYKGGIL